MKLRNVVCSCGRINGYRQLGTRLVTYCGTDSFINRFECKVCGDIIMFLGTKVNIEWRMLK